MLYVLETSEVRLGRMGMGRGVIMGRGVFGRI